MSDDCEEDTKLVRLLEEKAKRRKLLRNYFQKQRTDPFRHISEEGGAVFDPAIQRYIALQNNWFEYFKPTFRNAFRGILGIAPMVIFGYFIHKSRNELECRLRCGEISYRDRRNKFI